MMDVIEQMQAIADSNDGVVNGVLVFKFQNMQSIALMPMTVTEAIHLHKSVWGTDLGASGVVDNEGRLYTMERSSIATIAFYGAA